MKKTVLLTLSLALTSLFALGQEAFKITHGPYLQAMDEAGVNIIWTTNKNAISWVELAQMIVHIFIEQSAGNILQ